jgi:hypothetical protein
LGFVVLGVESHEEADEELDDEHEELDIEEVDNGVSTCLFFLLLIVPDIAFDVFGEFPTSRLSGCCKVPL